MDTFFPPKIRQFFYTFDVNNLIKYEYHTNVFLLPFYKYLKSE